MSLGPGLHLMMDGPVPSNRSRVKDEPTGSIFLRRLVSVSGMTLIAGPFIYLEKSNIHGFAILAESHCAFHLFQLADEGQFVFVDLYSCKEFKPEKASRLIAYTFGGRLRRVHLLTREIPAPLRALAPVT